MFLVTNEYFNFVEIQFQKERNAFLARQKYEAEAYEKQIAKYAAEKLAREVILAYIYIYIHICIVVIIVISYKKNMYAKTYSLLMFVFNRKE